MHRALVVFASSQAEASTRSSKGGKEGPAARGACVARRFFIVAGWKFALIAEAVCRMPSGSDNEWNVARRSDRFALHGCVSKKWDLQAVGCSGGSWRSVEGCFLSFWVVTA